MINDTTILTDHENIKDYFNSLEQIINSKCNETENYISYKSYIENCENFSDYHKVYLKQSDFDVNPVFNYTISASSSKNCYFNNDKVSETSNNLGGTLRLVNKGIYILSENITLNFNQEDMFYPTLLQNSIPVCQELIKKNYNQKMIYPTTNSFGSYDLGFFSGITMESNDIIIDLNGFKIEFSKEMVLLQRFTSIIELGSSPFIPGVGPMDIGPNQNFTKDCIIMSSGNKGILGRSSHFGIHGNANININIHNLDINSFEAGGICLNNAKNIVIDDCIVHDSFNKVRISSNFTGFRSLHISLRKIIQKLQGNKLFNCFENKNKLSEYKLNNNVIDINNIDIDKVIHYIKTQCSVNSESILEKWNSIEGSLKLIIYDFINLFYNIENFIKDIYKYYIEYDNILFEEFNNIKGLPDGICYGIYFHSKGIGVNGFNSCTNITNKNDEKNMSNMSNMSNNIFVTNCKIYNIKTSPEENVGITDNNFKPIIASNGSIVDINKLSKSNIYYTYLIKLYTIYKRLIKLDLPETTCFANMLGKAIKPSTFFDNIKTILTILKFTQPRIFLEESIESECIKIDDSELFGMEEDYLNMKKYYYADIMNHVLKGNMGLRVSGTKNLLFKNNFIEEIHNYGEESMNEFKINNIMHEHKDSNFYDGTTSRGIVISCSEDIFILDNEIRNIKSEKGKSLIIDNFNPQNNRNIVIKNSL